MRIVIRTTERRVRDHRGPASRNSADYTRRLADLAVSISRLKARSLHLDGEVVAMDKAVRPSKSQYNR
jgi:ATP-dependent DNA ligase